MMLYKKINQAKLILLLSMILIVLGLSLAGCGNKRIKEVDSKIAYFEGRYELLEEKINNFIPEVYSIDLGLQKVDELGDENLSIVAEVYEYIESLLQARKDNPKRKHYTKEQMDKLLLLGHRTQKNHDILQNYVVRINHKLHMFYR